MRQLYHSLGNLHLVLTPMVQSSGGCGSMLSWNAYLVSNVIWFWFGYKASICHAWAGLDRAVKGAIIDK